MTHTSRRIPLFRLATNLLIGLPVQRQAHSVALLTAPIRQIWCLTRGSNRTQYSSGLLRGVWAYYLSPQPTPVSGGNSRPDIYPFSCAQPDFMSCGSVLRVTASSGESIMLD
jgi:hypothetical protein